MTGSMRGDELVPEVEFRFTPGIVELRTGGDSQRIGGYGAVFNKLSRNLGGFVERLDPAAFNGTRSAQWAGVLSRYNHDKNVLLGTTAGRTLELRVDGDGLWYDVVPPKARADILELVQRGDVRSSSFEFRVMPEGDDWTTTDQGYPMRTLLNVQLFEVGPVDSPAYPDATAGLRSLANKFEADLAEVRSMAVDDELRKFFVRTDGPKMPKPKKKLFGPAAAAALMARRADPWG
jgi:HK97 family phage prohead protease